MTVLIRRLGTLAVCAAVIGAPTTALAGTSAGVADRDCPDVDNHAQPIRARDGHLHCPVRTSGVAAKRRSCGTITSTSVYPFARVVAIRGVRCRRARRVARIYDHEGRSPGRWRCFLAHGDRPRLFSCGYPPTRGDIRGARHALEVIGARRRARQ